MNARQAGNFILVPRDKVGNWLYGVAYRTALEARKVMIRRRNKEKPLTDLLDPNQAKVKLGI